MASYPDENDPRALAAGMLSAARRPPAGVTYGPFGERYEYDNYEPPTVMGIDPMTMLGRFAFSRAPVGSLARGPWSPVERPARVVREGKLPGDDSVGQHIYEAVLGRTRNAGEAVAQPGSGWWHVAGQPIPKPTNPLPWILSGGLGYGLWHYLGGQRAWDELRDQPWNRPGTPEYEARERRLNEHTDEVMRSGDRYRINARFRPWDSWSDPMGARHGVPVLPDQPY